MAERKVLNKYYPPDYDASLIPRMRQEKNKQHSVRLMLPMSIQCKTCGEYIGKGKKFNGRKEEALGEDYLGIKVWRFYLRCTQCLNEITFKTDPRRNDYTVEKGAARNFEPWRQESLEAELERKKKEREEMGDAMKKLENRTEASKREMDIQDAIEDVKELNDRGEAINSDELLASVIGKYDRLDDDDIEQQALAAFGCSTTTTTTTTTTAAGASSSSSSSSDEQPDAVKKLVVRRVEDRDDVIDDHKPTLFQQDTFTQGNNDTSSAHNNSDKSAVSLTASLPLTNITVKKRKHDDAHDKKKKKKEKKDKLANQQHTSTGTSQSTNNTDSDANNVNALGGLLGAYDDDSD